LEVIVTTDDGIASRKLDHLEIVLGNGAQSAQISTGFDQVRFVHCALPEMHLNDVMLDCVFLGRPLKAPLLISSMTGGPQRSANVNLRLAEAAQAMGIAFAVGSQRIALEHGGAGGFDKSLRKAAPGIPIYANFGAAQLGLGYGLDEARRAIDMIEADALIVHLNPLQEAVQAGGDHGWSGILDRIERVVRALAKPVIVKEVGFGISAQITRQLRDCGVAAVDVAGAGGTNWAMVEAQRAVSDRQRAIAAGFAGWGIPTAQAILEARRACAGLPIIGSGGIKTGVDAAKAIRLGADLVGQAAGVLAAAVISTQAVTEVLSVAIEQLRICCFCTGSPTLADLRRAPLLPQPAAQETT
jgi:isopentenyl-diphosphate Delta-isomerase